MAWRSAEAAAALLEVSRECRWSDLAAMLSLGELALKVALNLAAVDAGGNSELADLRCRALANLGNAQRMAGDFAAAAALFRRADAEWQRGTRSPSVRGSMLADRASLFESRRKFEEALRDLAESERIFRGLGDAAGIAVALNKMAIVHAYAENPARAVSLLLEAAEIAPAANLALRRSIGQCLVLQLVAVGRPSSAMEVLVGMTGVFATGDRLSQLKLAWARARVLKGLGSDKTAAEILGAIRREYLRLGMTQEAALLSLELAVDEAGRGRWAEVAALLREVEDLFRALGIWREMLGARLLATEASRRRGLGYLLATLRRMERGVVSRARRPRPSLLLPGCA